MNCKYKKGQKVLCVGGDETYNITPAMEYYIGKIVTINYLTKTYRGVAVHISEDPCYYWGIRNFTEIPNIKEPQNFFEEYYRWGKLSYLKSTRDKINEIDPSLSNKICSDQIKAIDLSIKLWEEF